MNSDMGGRPGRENVKTIPQFIGRIRHGIAVMAWYVATLLAVIGGGGLPVDAGAYVRETAGHADADDGPLDVIVKVRDGFLPGDGESGAAIAAAGERRAARVVQLAAGAGVSNARSLWPVREFGADPTPTPGPAAAGPGTMKSIDPAHPGLRTFVLALGGGADADEVARSLERQPWVEYAEVDRLFALDETLPGDSLFANQWYLQNTGQSYLSVEHVPGFFNDTLGQRQGTAGADVGYEALRAHAGMRSTVLLAVLDSGVDPDHIDLAPRMWINPGEIADNGIDDDHNGFVDDTDGWDFSGDSAGTLPTDIVGDNDVSDYLGHGSHVAGIAGAVAGNGLGVAGVSDSIRVMACKIFPNAYFSVSSQAVYYAVAMGARVLNMSWGGDFVSKTLSDAIAYGHARGALSVAAAGNTGDERNHFPAALDHVLAVGATTSRDRVASFSTIGNFVDMSAPGQMILSLRGAGTDLFADAGEPDVHIIDEHYLIASGTSMASPLVAGGAAALWSLAPGLTNDEMDSLLRESAHDILDPYGGGQTIIGWDKFSGAGRLDLGAALSLLPTLRAEITTPAWDQRLTGAVSVAGTAAGTGFSGYTLSYGEGLTPSTWTTILTGVTPVVDGELGLWDPIGDGLAGVYALRLEVGAGAVAQVPVTVVPNAVAELAAPADGDTVALFGMVMGTAAAPSFSHYTVETVGPLPSQSVTVIHQSTRPVFGDTLTPWALDDFSGGDYYLRVTTEHDGGAVADSVLVHVENPFAAGWPVTLPELILPTDTVATHAHFAILAADLDHDGTEEVVVPSSQGVWVLSADGSVYPGWPRDTLVDFEATPAVVDLDGDGPLEVIVTQRDAVHVYSFIGEQYQGWPQPFDAISSVYGTPIPTVGYLDTDAVPEILAIDRFGKVHAWYESGEPYVPDDPQTDWSIDVTNSINASLPRVAVVNLNPLIGGSDVVATGDGIWIWEAETGQPYDDADPDGLVRAFHIVNGLAVADYDGDDVMELAVAYTNGPIEPFMLTIMEIDGTDLPGWPRSLGLPLNLYLLYSVASGDLDDDGVPEVLVAPYSLGEGVVFAFHADGSSLLPGDNTGRFAHINGSLSAIGLVDVDSDGRPEIVFKAGNLLSGSESIHAYQPDGTFVTGYPILFGAGSEPRPSMPLISDATGNDSLNMVTVHTTGRQIVMWDLPTARGYGGRPWTSFRADSWNTGVVPQTRLDILMVVRLIGYVFNCEPSLSGCGDGERARTPPPYEPSDVDCNGRADLLDIVTLINYVFRSGPRPCFP